MQKLNPKSVELEKLYTLLNKINQATLGADYELRWKLKHAKQEVIDKIKNIESSARHMHSVVK